MTGISFSSSKYRWQELAREDVCFSVYPMFSRRFAVLTTGIWSTGLLKRFQSPAPHLEKQIAAGLVESGCVPYLVPLKEYQSFLNSFLKPWAQCLAIEKGCKEDRTDFKACIASGLLCHVQVLHSIPKRESGLWSWRIMQWKAVVMSRGLTDFHIWSS